MGEQCKDAAGRVRTLLPVGPAGSRLNVGSFRPYICVHLRLHNFHFRFVPLSASNNTRPATGSPAQRTAVRLDHFDPAKGLDRGRSRLTEACWYFVKCFLFLSPLPWPRGWKVFLLRLFGAKIGHGVVIKPRVNIHFPWKLSIGDHSWIGEEVFILNFEPVTVGNHVCISQRSFLCAGNHDFQDPAFSYRNEPIHIEDGAWIGAQCFVAPGVTVRREAVATAGSVVIDDLPVGWICRGNPCEPVRERRVGRG